MHNNTVKCLFCPNEVTFIPNTTYCECGAKFLSATSLKNMLNVFINTFLLTFMVITPLSVINIFLGFIDIPDWVIQPTRLNAFFIFSYLKSLLPLVLFISVIRTFLYFKINKNNVLCTKPFWIRFYS